MKILHNLHPIFSSHSSNQTEHRVHITQSYQRLKLWMTITVKLLWVKALALVEHQKEKSLSNPNSKTCIRLPSLNKRHNKPKAQTYLWEPTYKWFKFNHRREAMRWRNLEELKELKLREYWERVTVEPKAKAIAYVASTSKTWNTKWALAHSCRLQN